MKRSCSPRALYKHLPKKLSPNHQANPCKSPMHELLVYVEEFDKIYPCQSKLVKTSLILQQRVQAFRCLAVADPGEGPEGQREKIGGTASLPPYLAVLIRRCFVRFFTWSTHLPAAMNQLSTVSSRLLLPRAESPISYWHYRHLSAHGPSENKLQ